MKFSALWVLLAGILWGCISIFVNALATIGFGSLEIVALRVFATAIVMLLYTLISNPKSLRIKLRHIPFFIGTGVISIVLFNFCYFEAIRLTGSVSISALLLYTSPIFVMVMSALFYKEVITRGKILALALTMVGLTFVTGLWTGGGIVTPLALFFGLGSGFCYALYSIFGKKITAIYSGTTITTYTFIMATIAGVPLSGVTQNFHLLANLEAILWVVGLAIFCTIIPYLAYTKGLQQLEPSRAAVFATIEPITATILGLLVYQESMTLGKLTGIALILVAIVLLNQKNRSMATK